MQCTIPYCIFHSTSAYTHRVISHVLKSKRLTNCCQTDEAIAPYHVKSQGKLQIPSSSKKRSKIPPKGESS